MTRSGFYLRLALSVVIDIVDFTAGRAMFLVPWEEGVGAGVLFFLWGPAGLVYLWELADVTEVFDGFIPTATLIGLYVGWRQGFIFGKPREGSVPATRDESQP
jgi:hypothetical protein